MKLGIIQGRLSPPDDGFQDCPVDWKREFNLLNDLGLNHIEWVVTKETYDFNPIHTVNLKKYQISSVCADFMVDENFLDVKYLDNYLKPICEMVIRNNIKCLTIPLLEKSSVVDDNNRDEFIKVMYPYLNDYADIHFLIESELGIDELKNILSISDDLGITYDTGNITSFGLDHELYIDSFRDDINQVHIKDRVINPSETVIPGDGDTDFSLIFGKLKSINYDGLYTLQTAREINGDEINTITKHKKIIDELYYV
tara:strand:+ start:2923 stop:3687 length:765 start_codon:yes stop_codon:yes gene_type:complete